MGEKQIIEYTRQWDDEWLKWLCGFANADGGTLYIGITDKQHIFGVENSKKLMEDMKKQYDYVFLDISCHLGTADIVSAGSSADEVLLLVRSGKTESSVIRQTAETLKRANLDISGVILNGVEEE